MPPRLGSLAALTLAVAPCLPAQLGPSAPLPGHPIILQQPGFPTIATDPVPAAALREAIPNATFVDLQQLESAQTLQGASLLVLPYGSAVPTAAWPTIHSFLQRGGNLLLLGGQPFHVPVDGDHEGAFTPQLPQDTYNRELGFLHTYAAPMPAGPAHFAWRNGYNFLPGLTLQPTTVFVEEGHLNGLGYLDAADGTHLASPILWSDHLGTERMNGSRVVALPIAVPSAYWNSADGKTLLRTAAHYAEAGASSLQAELQYTALRPGEAPALTLHLHQAGNLGIAGTARVELRGGDHLLATQTVPLGGAAPSSPVSFTKPLPAGVYTLRATWSPAGADNLQPQEFTENGFVVEDLRALANGPALGTHGDFLTFGGKPFFPVGTNYFSTDANGWDFSGPRNGATWDRDFADMERHGVTFVRTGVWMPSFARFVESSTGEANERFLRNVEGFLAAAHRHNIAVNFTFFAFTPHGQDRGHRSDTPEPPPPNPYLDATTVQQEQAYVTSVVRRFRGLPFLSYDLINEPSFSNPRTIFHGNVPNGDPAEVLAWQKWLEQHYGNLATLAQAWRVTPEQLGSFHAIPLPHAADLTYSRYGNQEEVRAYDYDLFAQDMFSGWVRSMVAAIRGTGSAQLINVGQDEGGVTNRLLNQFYATAGVSFTTNHTYWTDDALLWDSVAAKRPGLPNITGETGYQPAWNPDGTWRYDELTGTALEERKWALGFAAGSSGALQWDWDREVDFGMQRSDGSAKTWEAMMRDLGTFAKAAAPYATELTPPEVAVILPQSLQLSVYNNEALAAQQAAIRVLYQHNHVEAYAVGEYQTDTLGTPKLIILPSAYGLNAKAWADIEARVRSGATLLLSGPFSADEHLHPTDRARQLGLPVELTNLLLRQNTLDLPSGPQTLEYSGLKTTVLDRGVLPDGKTWTSVPFGQGKVFFSAFPLELNSNDAATAAAYDIAIQAAGIHDTYTTEVHGPGLLICPTRLPHATLYVLTSEAPTQTVRFTDTRTGKAFQGTLEAGRAALLLIGEHGDLLANYHWEPSQ